MTTAWDESVWFVIEVFLFDVHNRQLNRRRGLISNTETSGDYFEVECDVPLGQVGVRVRVCVCWIISKQTAIQNDHPADVWVLDRPAERDPRQGRVHDGVPAPCPGAARGAGGDGPPVPGQGRHPVRVMPPSPPLLGVCDGVGARTRVGACVGARERERVCVCVSKKKLCGFAILAFN